MHTIFLLVGRSASGKDSIADELGKRGYKKLKSYTTRPRRINEGDTHVFIDESEIYKYADRIIAHTRIGDYHYFATKDQLQENDIYIIDPNGVAFMEFALSEYADTDIRTVVIYINQHERVRYLRARQRGDEKEKIIKRFMDENDQFEEFERRREYDYAVTNNDLQKSVNFVEYIMLLETGEIANEEI